MKNYSEEIFKNSLRNLEHLEKLAQNITQDSVNFRLIFLLTTFDELALTELSKYSKKSKATISRHITQINKEMNNLILIHEKKVRGNIPAKIYCLDSNIRQILISMDADSQKIYQFKEIKLFLPKLLSLDQTAIFIMNQFHEYINNYINHLKSDLINTKENELSKIQKIVMNEAGFDAKFHKHLIFLTESQKDQFLPLYQDFNKSIAEIMVKPTIEMKQPYVFYNIFADLEEILIHSKKKVK